MSDAMIEATSVSALCTEGAEDAPLLPRSLLKQRWGEHFRAVRQAKSISQERLAARAGVALSAVANERASDAAGNRSRAAAPRKRSSARRDCPDAQSGTLRGSCGALAGGI